MIVYFSLSQMDTADVDLESQMISFLVSGAKQFNTANGIARPLWSSGQSS
jgi:hypothetical protein